MTHRCKGLLLYSYRTLVLMMAVSKGMSLCTPMELFDTGHPPCWADSIETISYKAFDISPSILYNL